MQAVRIANYKVINGTFPELAEEAKGGMLTTFRAQPGFIRYGLADTGEGTCVAISQWETRAEADAKFQTLQGLLHPELGVALMSRRLGFDLTGYPLDEPLPPLPENKVIGSRVCVSRDVVAKSWPSPFKTRRANETHPHDTRSPISSASRR